MRLLPNTTPTSMTARLSQAALGLVLLASAAPAQAAYTTVDLAAYLNGNLSISTDSYPTGVSTGNQATGIPFDVGTYGQYAGAWFAAGQNSPGSSPTLSVDLTSYEISGQASFYALLNNYYGQVGVNEYNVIITAINGDSVTYQSIGGVDTRDYNENNFANTIAGTTTPWFDNGVGQRLDVRQFALPDRFKDEFLASFQIVQLQYSDPAFLAGVTFSDAPAAFGVPEPASLSLLGLGFAGIAATRRSSRPARAQR